MKRVVWREPDGAENKNKRRELRCASGLMEEKWIFKVQNGMKVQRNNKKG